MKRLFQHLKNGIIGFAIGTCTGGLAGILYGPEEINKDWKNNLIKYDYIQKLCKEFVKTDFEGKQN